MDDLYSKWLLSQGAFGVMFAIGIGVFLKVVLPRVFARQDRADEYLREQAQKADSQRTEEVSRFAKTIDNRDEHLYKVLEQHNSQLQHRDAQFKEMAQIFERTLTTATEKILAKISGKRA